MTNLKPEVQQELDTVYGTTNSTIKYKMGATNEPSQTTNANTTQAQTPATTQEVTSSVTTPTSSTVPATGTGKTYYKTYKKYEPKQLEGVKGWVFPADRNAPSVLANQIMGYRRQFRSQGIALFVKEWLIPKLQEIVSQLEKAGYTVATKVINSGDTGHGYHNFMFDVSKDNDFGKTLYVAHYDTVDRDTGYSETRYGHGAPTHSDKVQLTRKHVSVLDGVAFINESNILNDDVACLGADDGAGLAVMLNLMANGVLGGYCFTTGEEVGGVGAESVLTHAEPFLKQYDFAVEIDRRGTKDMVYEQSVGECASKAFAQWLVDELGMGHELSNRGSYTDVATFAEVIPENVNIASGYINAHSADEQLLLPYLDQLADALRKVDWSKAKAERKAGDFNLPSYSGTGYGYGYGYGSGYSYGYGYSSKSSTYVKPDNPQLTEPVPDLLADLFAVDTDFMRHCVLHGGIECYYDLDTACYGYYGSSFTDICVAYGFTFEDEVVENA